MPAFHDIILTLQRFWGEQGCVILQPYDMEVGAGTSHTATFLRAIGPEHWKAAYVQPSRRPKDGRYGENPNRLQHDYLAWYYFKNFGADLRWRIVLTAPEDPMTDYTGASFDTPTVDGFDIEFVYVDRREYSRASAAATIITESGVNKKLVIGSSFIFPGWEGQLRAYDMTGVSFVAGSSSELQKIATSDLNDATGRNLIPGAGIYWDAGTLLNNRAASSRRIYTALRAGGTVTNPLVRTEFTVANLGNVSTAEIGLEARIEVASSRLGQQVAVSMLHQVVHQNPPASDPTHLVPSLASWASFLPIRPPEP